MARRFPVEVVRPRFRSLRYRGRIHHVGVGRAYTCWRVAMLINDRHIEIASLDGSPYRRLVLDRDKGYRPMADVVKGAEMSVEVRCRGDIAVPTGGTTTR